MIIARSPLRITLGGGGTDIPFYYERYGGFCIAAAIDRYVYVILHETFVDELIIKYSKMERVASVDQVEHPIFREALGLLGVSGQGLEIASHADIPAGTGLGSSSSFTTALLKALHASRNEIIAARDLAEEACQIELDQLHEPIGKQDQYIAAYGGLQAFAFANPYEVTVERLALSEDTLIALEENLLLFFTGYSRSASDVLRTQNADTDSLNAVKEVGLDTHKALLEGDLFGFAKMLNLQWDLKRKRSGGERNQKIAGWLLLGSLNGALGGKLVGAGGGGFLLFYAEDHARLRATMRTAGLREVRFRFDFTGTTVISQ